MARKPKAEKSRTTKPSAQARLPLTGSDFPLAVQRTVLTAARGAFDQETAVMLLGSLSLNFAEKLRVIEADIDRFQHDALLKVWHEETDKFALLWQEHPSDLAYLFSQNVCTGFMLARHCGLAISEDMEDALTKRMAIRAARRMGGDAISWISQHHPGSDQADDLPAFLKRQIPSRWDNQVFAWFWRHLVPRDHKAWQACPAASETI